MTIAKGQSASGSLVRRKDRRNNDKCATISSMIHIWHLYTIMFLQYIATSLNVQSRICHAHACMLQIIECHLDSPSKT